MRYYSRTTGTTYIKGVHAQMPADAVFIPEERYEAVIANPDLGKIRSHDATGLPVLVDPPAPTLQELADAERRWRDDTVADLEWLVTRHRDELDMQLPTTLSAEQFAQLLAYRQELRDWPQSEHFPDSQYRPVAPPWIVEQTQ
ncbi:phage tail assembly chaperone [Pseudomonas uvaldensis]|uniref:phage tail assembly chaperone n=1 Tax=Pseudomonas uvaldensis TaxID=2878385 RepID=UPI001E2C473E|nr:phage tail assembly chaperone [Pseudomonas uvaldensis]MCE0459952.1 phage tail assembly chaperone [Pseudomonas uvaldensis]